MSRSMLAHTLVFKMCASYIFLISNEYLTALLIVLLLPPVYTCVSPATPPLLSLSLSSPLCLCLPLSLCICEHGHARAYVCVYERAWTCMLALMCMLRARHTRARA